ncbi:MAG: peptidase [Oleispira sp.]|nr:peptidase [Oleispira sp.]|tara:strand:- start:2270 stop:2947 length:678 start_codon:yes stop_codon:yes gene_type:complete
MIWILVFLLVLGLFFFPQWWVGRVLKRHSDERDDFPGTGGELAQHLIEVHGLEGVKVEATEGGDHYDPIDKMVRLTPDKLDGRSLTAIVVAAHEVGHAIQDHNKEKTFNARITAAKFANVAQQITPIAFWLSPILAFVSPVVSRLTLGIAILSILASTLVHLITLPVEWDASFGKALPILEKGEYLNEQDMKDAHQILLAAALTYVAGSLASLLNVWRWLRYFRR